jgi:hypothetical protein
MHLLQFSIYCTYYLENCKDCVAEIEYLSVRSGKGDLQATRLFLVLQRTHRLLGFVGRCSSNVLQE